LLYNLGLTRQKAGDATEAAELYRRALAAEPEFAEALLNLGHALGTLGDKDEAKDCWRKALELKPELASGYFES
jgi:tetratricopeptide (TPR) repeat protein